MPSTTVCPQLTLETARRAQEEERLRKKAAAEKEAAAAAAEAEAQAAEARRREAAAVLEAERKKKQAAEEAAAAVAVPNLSPQDVSRQQDAAVAKWGFDRSEVTVSLYGKGITDDDCKLIAAGVMTLPGVTTLYLSRFS